MPLQSDIRTIENLPESESPIKNAPPAKAIYDDRHKAPGSTQAANGQAQRNPKSLLRYLDYVFITRPVLFFPGWATLLAGILAAWGDFSVILGGAGATPYALPGMAIFSFGAVMGGCFIFNQLQDIDSDRKNKKLFLLGDGYLSIRHGYIEAIVLLLVGHIAGITIGWAFVAMLSIFSLVTGYIYNYAPFSFKSYPLRGLLANMLMGWLAFFLGWCVVAAPDMAMLLQSLPYLTFNTALYFLTTVPDVDGDRDSDKKTFPVKYGVANTLRISAIFGLLTIVGAWYFSNNFMVYVGMLTTLFLVWSSFKQTAASAIISVKAGILCFALGVAIKFPAFLLLTAAAFFFTRFYYRQRFEFDYPNFHGK